MTDIRFACHPKDVKNYSTQEIRSNYLVEEVMIQDDISVVYSMHDRMITMGIVPVKKPLTIHALEDLTKSSYFLERREMGIINVGGAGHVTVDGEVYELHNKECLYIGKGKKVVTLASNSAGEASEFYINSCPAHSEHPTSMASIQDANEVNLGSKDTCNERTIYQYIHDDGIQSCQLVMGITLLKSGSIWNTFPPHTHLRRMEVYFYFDLPEDQIVMHIMGEPKETRHIAVHNKQAVISPEWSVHAGAGTSAYSFVWAMAGENKAFIDMDGQELINIK